MKQTQKGNTALVAVIVIVVAIAAGAIGWILARNSQTPVQQTATTQPTTPKSTIPTQPVAQTPIAQPTTDKTTGWNTYTNKRYGYTISYPKNWFVDTTYSEDAITQRGDPSNADFIGGDTNWSNYKGSFDLGNIPKDIQTVFLMISKQDKATTLDEYLKIENFDFDKKESVQINGITGVRISGGHFDVPDPNVEHIILMRNGLFYNFSNGMGEKSLDARNILETMISTLKFQ